MPVYQSNAKLLFDHCMNVDFSVQNGPETMKDNLSSAANIIHFLLNASNRYWLDPKGKEGPQSLYSARAHRWWHFLASTPLAFQDFAQWHCQGFLIPPPVVSAPPSTQELHAAVLNFVLLYLANMPPVPVSSPPSSNTLSNSDKSLAMPSAETLALPPFQCANSPTPPQGLWQLLPSPSADIWQPFSFKGWNQDKIQRHREAFDLDYKQGEEEMLLSFSKDTSCSQPPALHQLLEKNTNHLINHLNCWKQTMLQEITQEVEDTIQRLLPVPAAPEPHTLSRRTFITVEDTPRAATGSGSSGNRDFLIPVKTGDESEEKGKKKVKLESPEPSRMWKVLHTPLSLGPLQLVAPDTSEHPRSPIEQVNTPHTNKVKGFIAAQPGETEEEKENRTMHNLATMMGRALSVPLQSTFRSLSQTPGPAQPKSKIPAPEKYDGKKGPAAKSFILDCKTYFFSNSSSFHLDHSHISLVLMNLKEGQPKKWGQIVINKGK
ncbi:hypothetical protein BN14_07545 [Rhizoctonia solani AG-1 IB]|uniref:Uncharacterized protein n=1 Tax=Thanatephorus cucumeris (strain AG1-IB / isolate 7/3/14) TaxID=1108050 RepID=M5CC88_THACB|nr:hypothetical protein BN14_07545 [Rhizoctonia solani AG-1 IB]